MRLEDCLALMTKNYLARVVDALVHEGLPRGDEERLREQVRQNQRELLDPARVREVLDLKDDKRANRILIDEILSVLLESSEMALTEEQIFAEVRKHERAIIESAPDHPALEFTDPKALETYQIVLEVALEDDVVTSDEFALLERLRRHLGISRLEHRLLEARLGKFPKPGNALHSFEDLKEASKRLQTLGILLYCNRAEGGPLLVLPEGIAETVAIVMGFEMRRDAQALLHEALTSQQLRMALKANGIPLSGSKSDRSERLVSAGVRPSEVLDALPSSELGELCRSIQGLKVSGTKQERMGRIVQYFAQLSLREPEVADDPRALFYAYYEELGRRESQNLYQRKLIKSDREIDRAFETATAYLFECKLGLEVLSQPGSDHADGCIAFPKGELLLWDNKSSSKDYKFPVSHVDQFLRYIKGAEERVTVFLVIVPEVAPNARLQAMKLKHRSGTDTDVALITAEDLKYVAETWKDHAGDAPFNLEVLNATGVLDRVTLDERMAVLLGL